jgi:hypothetical protein
MSRYVYIVISDTSSRVLSVLLPYILAPADGLPTIMFLVSGSCIVEIWSGPALPFVVNDCETKPLRKYWVGARRESDRWLVAPRAMAHLVHAICAGRMITSC